MGSSAALSMGMLTMHVRNIREKNFFHRDYVLKRDLTNIVSFYLKVKRLGTE